MEDEKTKLFISYGWSSPEHEQWVLNLATELVEAGVDVMLDKWDLKEGHDAYAFMERMVTDPSIKKVIIVCDRMYADKSNKRHGGAGTEAQIISPEIYEKENQDKFVAVLAERDEDGNSCLPVYYKSRIYIDLSNGDLYATNFEQLLRWIYNKPLYIKPKIGKKPSFLSDDNQIILGTTSRFKRALDSIHNHKDYAKGAISDFFSTFASHLEEFRIKNREGEFDDQLIDNINKFLPYRNEVFEIFLAISQYRNTSESIDQIHRFLESLIPYLGRPEGITSYQEWDYDNFKFIVNELFIYAVSSLLKYECFDSISYLLSQNYYLEKNSDYGKNVMVGYPIFYNHLRSLEHRNERLKLNRISVHADVLEQRSKTIGMPFRYFMQADFVLFLRDAISCYLNSTYQSWWPISLVYLDRHSGPFEIFARAESKLYFDRLSIILGIKNKSDLAPIMTAFKEGKLQVPRWNFKAPNPLNLIGYEKMATLR